jgi:hypothetical protein
LVVLIEVQVSVVGLYLPPVFVTPLLVYPPQTIISVPVQTAANRLRPAAALVVLVGVQLSVPGLYLPPVFVWPTPPTVPPQTIISEPVQNATCCCRASGTLITLVAAHVSLHPGSWRRLASEFVM